MSYTLTVFTLDAPVQAEGQLDDGREFDFYARRGHWRLMLTIAEGDDPTYGHMDENEIRAILDKHLPLGGA
jgi:hypothetical protein